jgi:hypothetical protein
LNVKGERRGYVEFRRGTGENGGRKEQSHIESEARRASGIFDEGKGEKGEPRHKTGRREEYEGKGRSGGRVEQKAKVRGPK